MKNWIKYILVVLIMVLSASALRAKSLTIEMKEAGTFQEIIGSKLLEIDSLTIVGPFDKTDFKSLQPAIRSEGRLKYLNIKEALLPDNRLPENALATMYEKFTKVILPPNLEIIGQDAFRYNYVEINELPENLVAIETGAFTYSNGVKHVRIPKSCQSFGVDIFKYAPNLQTLEFPEGITNIPSSVAYRCESLYYVYIPNSVITIERTAFCHDKSLKAIELPDNLERIDYDAFYDSGLIDLVLPASLKLIQGGALQNTISGTLYCKASVPPICDQEAKYEVFSDYNKTLYVPVGCAEAYRNTPVWCNFKDIRETDDFPVAGVKSTEKAEPLHITAGTGYLIIHSDTEQAEYAVYDAAGQLKAKGDANADTQVDLPAGIYVVTLGSHTAKVCVH